MLFVCTWINPHHNHIYLCLCKYLCVNVKVYSILPKSLADTLCPKDSRLANLYGLPKTHMPELALRLILSTTGTNNYPLAKWLEDKLKPLATNAYTISYIFQFSQDIRNTSILVNHKYTGILWCKGSFHQRTCSQNYHNTCGESFQWQLVQWDLWPKPHKRPAWGTTWACYSKPTFSVEWHALQTDRRCGYGFFPGPIIGQHVHVLCRGKIRRKWASSPPSISAMWVTAWPLCLISMKLLFLLTNWTLATETWNSPWR